MNNFYEVEIKTLNQDKILNNISKQIKLYDIKKIEYNILKLKVKYSNKKILNNYLKNNNIEILNNKSTGLQPFIIKLINRFGIITGIIISIISFFILNNIIFSVKIIGNNKINTKEILDFINKNNYNNTFQYKINCNEIERSLQENFIDISLVSCIKKGSTLVINIKEKLDNDVIGKKFKPMVASYDGKITDIILSQGTLNVKVGETVKKGQILVYPYIYDSSGNKKDILPQASIKAKVWITGEKCYKENQIIFERTGKKEKTNVLTIGKIYLNTKKNTKFKKYDTQESVFYISKNNIMPIKVHKYIFYETVEKRIHTNFEKDKQKIIKECKQIALQKLSECDIIKNERVSITNNAGIANIKVILELEKDITYEN